MQKIKKGKEGKHNKEILKVSYRSFLSGTSVLGWLVGWLVLNLDCGWVCAVNRAQQQGGVCIRVCEDRSDVLFDLSAADHRRLYLAGKCAGPIRYLSDAIFNNGTIAASVREPLIRFLGQLRD